MPPSRARLLSLALLFALVCAPVAAQTWRGAVRGTVVDASGAVVAGAEVTIRHDATGAVRRTASGERGGFAVPALPPGPYTLEVRAAGHKTFQRPLDLQVNQERRVDVRLEVGDVTEVVSVEAPRAGRRDNAAIGTTIDATQIRSLPLDGRNFLDLALLTPGTAPAPQGSASSVRGDFAFTANGAREDFNSYLLDGADNVDPKLNTVAVRPAVDAIEEFEVQTSAYDAAFGRYAGAQVNVVTRAGTNTLGGSAYGFVRNGALDARNAFAPASEPAPEYERYQAGASLGGPIVQGRTFFFADYEGTRRREGITRLTTVPTLAERSGDFRESRLGQPRNPLTGQPLPVIPSFFQHPAGRQIAALYPLPNRAGSAANFVSSPTERDDAHQFDVRLDQAWAGGGQLTARYSFSDRRLFEPFSGPSFSAVPGFGNDVDRRAQNLLVNDARVIAPAWLNDLRVAWTRVASGVTQQLDDTATNAQALLPVAGAPRDLGLTFISVFGYSPLGHEFNNPQASTTSALQVSDTITWSRGRHLVKLGGEARFIRQDAFRDVLARGQMAFTGLITGHPVADLLLGAPTFTVGARLDNPQRLRTETWAVFAQDSWQVRPSLTLNAGVRYERFAPPVDADDRATVYDQTARRLVQVGTGGIPRAGYEADTDNLAPRVGFAWTPTASGRTLVRGGYGIYYSQAALAPGEALYFSPPQFTLSFFFPLPGLPLSLSDPFPAFFPFPTPPSALAFQPDLKTPFLHHWNVGVEQQVGDAWSLSLAYVGSRGRSLLAARDLNQPVASAAPFNPRPDPQFADITVLESRARSEYDALLASAQRRFVAGLSLLGAYTLARSNDDASGFFSSAGDANFPQDSRNPEREWGRSSFDVRHRLSLGAIYDLPFDGHALARGWQVSGILTLQSGRPFTVALLPDIDNSNTGRSSLGFGFNDRPNVSGDPVLADPTAARWFNTGAFSLPRFGTFGNVERNSLEGPGFANLNLAILKHVPLGGARLQLRAEAFNLFNRVNYHLPDNFFGSPTFGQVLSADQPRRIQFGARVTF